MTLTEYALLRGGTGTIRCPVFAAMAADAECSAAVLYMIAKGFKRAGHKLAKSIETATAGKVTRYDLRPDIFGPAPKRKAA